jgi:myosin-crossreactive antigen
MTRVNSGWLMSIVVPYQPHFPAKPEDTYTLWGYGLLIVEYSVHGAMHAVYQLFGVDMEIPPSYHGLLDPKVGLKALESAFR